MRHPNLLMLVRIAQGDAYGMACEFIKLPRDQQLLDRALRFERYLKHPTHRLRAGQYTDDTQMSIAVAEVLLEVESQSDAELRQLFADAFVRAFKRDPREGYARGFQAFLEVTRDGTEFLANINPTSDKNGAAMRSVPIGVLPKVDDVIRIATLQAKLTHDTEGGVTSSVLVALMSHFAHHTDKPFSALPLWLSQHYPFGPQDWSGGPVTGPGVGMNTVHAVYTLLRRNGTLLNIARTALEWGGDTDSVLAIAWGIASARMPPPEPSFLWTGLEDGPFGRRFLAELGSRLMDKYGQPTFVPQGTPKSLA